jgi:hypothetical protein
MNKGYYQSIGVILLLVIILGGCATPQSVGSGGDMDVTCVRGRVSYQSPIDASSVPYPSATVSAWKKEAEKPLSEARTNQGGNYCIEIPIGDFRVDLRVWGLVFLEGTTYICQGSESNFNPGKTPLSCGADCKVVDIMTECKERVPSPRR